MKQCFQTSNPESIQDAKIGPFHSGRNRVKFYIIVVNCLKFTLNTNLYINSNYTKWCNLVGPGGSNVFFFADSLSLNIQLMTVCHHLAF